MSRVHRRTLVAVAITIAAAAATTGVAMATAAPSTAPAPAVAVQPVAKAEAPAPDSAAPEHVFLGQPVATGSNGPGGELVFRFVKIDEPEYLPDVHFGLLAGRTDAKGVFTGHYATNETEGSDTAPGFHGASIASDNGRIPAFGYYAGPATKITATIGGKTVQAHQAAWSEDPAVKVWWFDYSTKEPSNLAAFDAAGAPLPLGNNSFGRG
ncbi:hypothetical protein SAMN05192558_1129 [Actinokineospora alba]|uniref:Uncharacterized protein n=1 Tax=Actinokineospora alba TaxID=504798 RepID=A0A1H0UQW5_9PSEU|nr:hypothetical protein [Actinokineospora alba]TDP69119.1 hypothetical protein C8E96_4690 [Actinokineospora alba]SDI80000.1 hypothetical protein SAMN05421871_107395 [Actinokineospora alba]SDP68629.1 hypothetical protein SAMN05192558_1129 [Actinokineospora alba]